MKRKVYTKTKSDFFGTGQFGSNLLKKTNFIVLSLFNPSYHADCVSKLMIFMITFSLYLLDEQLCLILMYQTHNDTDFPIKGFLFQSMNCKQVFSDDYCLSTQKEIN